MPEGHVTHRMASAYERTFGGRPARSSSPQGRFAEEAAIIDGRVLDSAECFGKHLFCHFGHDIVHIHLGMAGKTRLNRADGGEDLGEEVVQLAPGDPGERPVLGAVRWRIENDEAWLDLTGPAICELTDAEGQAAVLERLGPDPLRADADPERAWQRLHRSKLPIAALLMDQSVFAGVGNIFRAEALYRAGLDPMLPGVALKRVEFEQLWDDLCDLMAYAVDTGRIDTVRPEDDPAATGRAARVDRHGGEVYVYRRDGQPCHVCGTTVKTTTLATRNLFWCPTCQPLSRRAAAVAARRKQTEARRKQTEARRKQGVER
ncbi:endonuclease-8/formamidopyrimidine-DNA glycosylase [Kineosphaera limosa]|uniref:DNA-(apurinic or apyrimidinic site) lyase n=1 Tax=Kineosphaera limosa NBRC 100340 TaxID=1184609 RepID=K6WB01_9MICO|nr:zinc finger domain-containing protein [Kineosphaera limosa]NYE00788.1 endonuclease-8/formamidopyrimidine-DNA glycosylase [Kineosphaera limosa]GAB96400.1 DNA glycosylase/AP lyase Nei [Kineosphaera limosa NBRC 100340]